MRSGPILPAIVCALLAAGPAFSQGNPTGTISGHIIDASGSVLLGVTVTAGSPALQGARTTVSTENGDYVLPFLPAGQYTITFELQGFKTLRVQQGVAVAQTYPINVTLDLASVSETIQVVGKAETISQTATAAASVKQELMQVLPTTRTLNAAVLLVPGVKDTGPGNNITIQGAQSYENLFLVNGVVVNENLRGQSLPLYIEDALEETTVLTSGVSAEYGRFSGGVVHAISKSGGNRFSGSFRDSLTNDNWRTLTPYRGDRRTNVAIPSYEFTFGGPIVKDRLWFFGAGRLRDATTSNTGVTAPPLNASYTYGSDEKRAEGKLTYSPDTNNMVRGSYAVIRNTDVNSSVGTIMDGRSLFNRKTPQDLLSLSYTAILTPTFFVEAQYSQRRLTYSGYGSPNTDPIYGTLLLDAERGKLRYWSPTFCGVCTDETRNNQDVLVKGTYFMSKAGSGSHSMVFGFDNYRDKRLADNHQSGSDYRIYGTTSIVAADGTIYPVFNNNDTTQIMYNPVPVSSKGNNFQTYSLFYSDAWQYSNRLSLNLGIRWDKNHGTDQTGSIVVEDSAFSPRLAATFDPQGEGKLTFTAGYARYVMSIANSIADAGAGAGNPATYLWWYKGPAINTGSGPYLTPDQALPILFDWFNSVGGPNNTTLLIGAGVPGVSTRVGRDLTSPSVHEFAGGVSRQIGDRATVRADVTYRRFRDFYSTRVDQSTGQVTTPEGLRYDLNVVENTNNVRRQYAGLNLQATWRLPRTNIGGNYTLSRTWGAFDGESASSGPISAQPNYYPEYFVPEWNHPVGDLSMDQRHRVRAWLSYSIPVKQALGTLDLAVLQGISSGTPYGAAGTVKSSSYVPASVNSAYVTPMGASGVVYYFTARDAYRTETDRRTDLALNYAHKVGISGSEVFLQAQLLNVFNQFALYNTAQINTTVLTRSNSSAMTVFNPFTETPVQGVNWSPGPLFGQAINKDAYTTPRTFRFSVGFRF